ncbi:MAG TPA: hypothetical protein VI998_04195 [Patescibacteria group bacterium]|nr:hypothetical protein [Patescibacteria group bacterium]
MVNEQSKEYTIDDFRKEIAEIAKKEAEEGRTADFSNKEIDPGKLTAEDMKIWLKIIDRSVTQEDFEEYREIYKKEKGFEIPIRHGFLSLAGNKANRVIGERWLEEEKKKKNKK